MPSRSPRRPRRRRGRRKSRSSAAPRSTGSPCRRRSGSISPSSTRRPKGTPSSRPTTGAPSGRSDAETARRAPTTSTRSPSSTSSGAATPQPVEQAPPRTYLRALTGGLPTPDNRLSFRRNQEPEGVGEKDRRSMPWSNQSGGGGPWGQRGSGGGGGPWGAGPQGGGGGSPPDLEEILRRGQDRIKNFIPGGGGAMGGKGLAVIVLAAI